MMTGYERSDEDYQPLAWFRGYPIYVSYFLVAAHVASLVIFSLLEFALNNPELTMPLCLSVDGVLHHFRFWQVFTYAFVHPLSFNFVIEMALLLLYGRETERFLGRRVFLTLYAALLVTTPLVVLAMGAITGVNLPIFAGSFALHFGVFITFAVIYPSVQIFFGIATKWIAWIFLAFYSLLFLVSSRGNPALLPTFWADVLVGYLGVRYAGAGGGLPFLENFRLRFRRKIIPSGIKPRLKPRRLVESGAAAVNAASSGTSYSGGGELHDSIDPLLDKISKHGLASLTHSERAALERARVSLLRKERGS